MQRLRLLSVTLLLGALLHQSVLVDGFDENACKDCINSGGTYCVPDAFFDDDAVDQCVDADDCWDLSIFAEPYETEGDCSVSKIGVALGVIVTVLLLGCCFAPCIVIIFLCVYKRRRDQNRPPAPAYTASAAAVPTTPAHTTASQAGPLPAAVATAAPVYASAQIIPNVPTVVPAAASTEPVFATASVVPPPTNPTFQSAEPEIPVQPSVSDQMLNELRTK